MTGHRTALTDELLQQMLRARTSEPDALLATEILTRVDPLPQERPWWAPLITARQRPALAIALVLLLLLTLIAVVVVGARLLERSRLGLVADNGPIVSIDFDACRFIRVDPTSVSMLVAAPEEWNCPDGVASNETLSHDSAWSRDGSVLAWSAHWLCFACTGEPDQTVVAMSGIWIRERGGESRQIIHCGTDYCPTLDLAPDGRRVAFTRGVLGAGEGSVVVADLIGNVIWTLPVAGDVLHTRPVYSPDGSRIALTVERDDGTTELLTMNADGSDASSVYSDPEHLLSQAHWSPDSTRMALVSRDPTGDTEVLVVDVDDGQAVRLGTGPAVLSIGDNGGLDWGPDEGHLLLASTVGSDPENSPIEILAIDIADGSRTVLYRSDCCANAASADYSPDGKWIAVFIFSQSVDMSGLYIMRVDGSEFHKISSSGSGGRWQPVMPGQGS